MSIKHMDFSSLGSFLEANKEKPVIFAENSELALVSKYFIQKAVLFFENNPDKIENPENIIDAITSGVDDDIDATAVEPTDGDDVYMSMLDKYAGKMAIGFKEAMIELKNGLAKDVTNLSNKIDESIATFFANENMSFLLKDMKNDDTDKTNDANDDTATENDNTDDTNKNEDEINNDEDELCNKKILDFDEVGIDDDVMYINLNHITNISIDQLKKHSMYNYGIMLERNANKNITNIKLNPEARLTLVKNIVNQSKMSGDLVDRIIDDFLNDNRYVINVKMVLFDKNSTAVDKCFNFKKVIADHMSLAHEIKDVTLELTDSDSEAIKNNAQLILDNCEIMKYFLTMKKEAYKDTAILTKDVFNKDGVDAYLVTGGKKQDIHKHLFVFYTQPNFSISQNGVPNTNIIEFKQKTDDKYNEYKEDILKKKNEYKRVATLRGFSSVTTDYLKSIPSNEIPSSMKKETFVNNGIDIANNISKGILNKDNTVEDSMYEFFIALKYKNTLVEKIYRGFCKESVIAVENNNVGTINADVMEAKICSDIFTNFIVDNFVK